MNLNSITISGNVGESPMIKEFDNGGKVANFSLAYNEKGFTTRDGKVIEDKTYWFDIQARAGMANYVEKAVQKGSKVAIVGKLRYREYTDNQQNNRRYTYIDLTSIEIMKT